MRYGIQAIVTDEIVRRLLDARAVAERMVATAFARDGHIVAESYWGRHPDYELNGEWAPAWHYLAYSGGAE